MKEPCIPHREIGEQDDELLEQLRKQLPDSQEDPFIADRGLKTCKVGFRENFV